jgi:post-segregation antitoxin (ccd killing protein)
LCRDHVAAAFDKADRWHHVDINMMAKAKAEGKSVSEIAREALIAAAKPSKEEAWAEIDRIRATIGKSTGDSTADIREWRDNDERYR